MPNVRDEKCRLINAILIVVLTNVRGYKYKLNGGNAGEREPRPHKRRFELEKKRKMIFNSDILSDPQLNKLLSATVSWSPVSCVHTCDEIWGPLAEYLLAAA